MASWPLRCSHTWREHESSRRCCCEPLATVFAAVLAVALLLNGCSLADYPPLVHCARQRVEHGAIVGAQEGEEGPVQCDAGFQPSRLAPGLRCVAVVKLCDDYGHCREQYAFEEAMQLESRPESVAADDLAISSQDNVMDVDDGVMAKMVSGTGSSMDGTGGVGMMRRRLDASAPAMPGLCVPRPGGPHCPARHLPNGMLRAADAGDDVRLVCNRGFVRTRRGRSLRCTADGFRCNASASPCLPDSGASANSSVQMLADAAQNLSNGSNSNASAEEFAFCAPA